MKKLLLPVVAVACTAGVYGQTYLSENFDAGSGTTITGWTATDVDADGQNWYRGDFSGYFAELGAGTAVSRSWTNTAGALTPNNFLTKQVDLSSASASGLTLMFKSGTIEPSPFHAEHYAVYVTTSADPATITSSTPVFEETLPSDGMFDHVVDMSSYAGQNVYVTFRHFNTNDMNTLLIDDVFVKNVSPNDAAIANVGLNRYMLHNTNNNLSVEVANVGSNAITSLIIDWNNGVSHPQTFTTNIAPGATAVLNHSTPITMLGAAEMGVNVTITQVNGGADIDMSNNSEARMVNSVVYSAEKTVLIEEGTGTWCGWCPRGAVAMEYMDNTYPSQFVGIAVHNSDPMTVTEYDNGANLSGYPGCNVDRALLDQSVSSSAFEGYYNARKDLIVPAQVGLEETISGSNITIEAQAVFHTPFSAANFRLAVVMVEDDVTGTSSGYAQTNYYSYASQNLPLTGAGHDWQAEPTPVPAADMVYDHVGRALLGGYMGQSGSVPTTLTTGQLVTYTFNYTVPASSDINNMHAVALLIDQETGEVLNAGTSMVDPSAGIEEVKTIEMNVYPNPASDKLTVAFEAENGDYNVVITDLQGRVVVSNNYANISGSQSIDMNVSSLISGNYLVTIATNGASYTKMVAIK